MIIIPMAGLSSRFFKAGYSLPKYMLKAKGRSLFDHSVESFSAYFELEHFVFILRDVLGTVKFVENRIKALGIKSFEIIVLDRETRGQAESVALGLSKYRGSNLPATIFNIDTFRPNFIFPDLAKLGDGYLEVFVGDGDNWSYVRPVDANGTLINKTAEKKPISNLCCTGLYHFKSVTDFLASYDHYVSMPESDWEKGEIYVAPLYNFLIEQGRAIHYNLIERRDVIFCGTPDEYVSFK